MTPQNESLPTRVPTRTSPGRRAVQLGVAGAVAVAASVVVPAALAQSGPEVAPSAAVVTTTSVAPSTSLAPSTTSTTAAPVAEAPVAAAPTPEELAQANLAAMSPPERLAFQLYVMTDAEREAFRAFVSPPPPPPPAPVAVPEPEVVVDEPSAEAPPVANGELWDALAQCEANGDWHINTGNGYSGGLQFHPGTWLAMGGGQYAPYAYLASREQQIAVGEQVLAAAGGRFTAWPGCRAKLGLP